MKLVLPSQIPLLPNPNEMGGGPTIDIPMDTGGMNTPKSPPRDNLQAMWYSLFGQSGSPDSTSTSPGNTSPLFMKTPLSSSNGSPTGRSTESLFGHNPMDHHVKSSPPGFPAPNRHQQQHLHHHHQQQQQQQQQQQNHHHQTQGRVDLQEALNSLLNNPHNISSLLGGSGYGGNGDTSSPTSPPFLNAGNNHQNMQQGNGHGINLGALSRLGGNGSLEQNGLSTALLELLAQSAKDQNQVDPFGQMKSSNSWSSGMSSPPSPIGNNRPFHNNNGHNQHHHMTPQRSGSNGSSEMSSSSPRSPTYSPFPRNSNKGLLLESGNGNGSPTPTTPWSNSVLGSPPYSGGHFGGHHHQQGSNNAGCATGGFQGRNIWAASPASLSPGNNGGHVNGNNSMMLNALGQKRKVHHEGGAEMDAFLHAAAQPSHGLPRGHPCSGINSVHSPPVLTNGSGPNGGPNGACTGANGLMGGGSLSGSNNIPMGNHYADSYFKKKKKN